MRSVEAGSFNPEINEDGGDGEADLGIDKVQMARNGITIIDFNKPPEGVIMLGEPFPAYGLWINLSRRPRSRRER